MRYIGCLVLVWLGMGLPGRAQSWVRTFGDTTRFDQGTSVVAWRDGGCLVLGTSDLDSAGGYDVLLTRLDAQGQVRWQRAFGTAQADFAQGLQRAGDTALVATGSIYDLDAGRNDAFVLLADTLGQLRWWRSYGDSLRNASFKHIAPLPDGFVATGYISSPDGLGNDTYVVRLDPAGGLRWTSPLRDSLIDVGHAALPLPDGGFMVAGDVQRPDGRYNPYVARLDSLGGVLWRQTFDSPYNGGAQSLLALRDGRWLLVGESVPDSTTTAFDFLLVKFDEAGQELWRRTLGDAGAEAAFQACELPDGDLYIGGYGLDTLSGQTDLLVVRTDSLGHLRARAYYGGAAIDHGYSLAGVGEQGFVAAGFATAGSDTQYLLVRDSLPALRPLGLRKPLSPPSLYPVPLRAGGRYTLDGIAGAFDVQIYDSQGAMVWQAASAPQVLRWPEGLTPGLYLVAVVQPGRQYHIRVRAI
ncbi:MAG: hypothetical protein OHK0039_04560 [Bacteroidia bacterium]